MEFWGVEIKAGETLKVQPGDEKLLHLSQATLGESKKGTDSVLVYLKFGEQKLVLGSLSGNCPQLPFDLVFEKEFELSHNWKNGSVYFMGYKSAVDGPEDLSDYSEFSSDEELALPSAAAENGKPEPQVTKAKESGKGKVKVVEPAKDEDDSDEDMDSDDSDELESDDEDSEGAEDDSEDDDASDESEDEETPTPKKVVGNKKRQAESASKTPVPAKKAKVASPQKTDGKKGGNTATPHPAKNASKTPNAEKSKTPKSGGDVTCKSCSKSFKSEQAMEAHSKAKHSGSK